MNQQIIILGVLASSLGSIAYIRDTVQGKTQPNRVSWLFWSIAPIIGSIISWTEGANIWEGLPVFMSGFIPLIIWLSTFFNPKSYWKLEIFDYVCGLLSLLAIIFWLIINQPYPAVILAILADFFAAIPTLKKSWQSPQSESWIVYVTGCVGPILGLLTLSNYGLVHSAFMIYILCINSLLTATIVSRRLVDKIA